MSRYKHILFDLDGTITDSFDAVTKSFAYALEHYGIKVEDRSTLLPVIGPPLREAFMGMFGFDEEKAIEATEKYRERYKVQFLREHLIYDGIEELLSKLHNDGFKLYLATAKPISLAEQLMRHFNLDKYFTYLGGASMDKKRDNKIRVLEHVFEKCDIEKSSAVMVGDRFHDLEGAAYMGIDAIGVTYGFGSFEELAPYNPVCIATTPEEIYNFLIK